MCGTARRGADALPGSKATSRAKGSHRNLGDLVSGRRRRVLCVYGGPHWEGEEPKPMMHGHEKSDLVIVAMKPANKAKEAHCGGVCGGERSGVGGAKGGGQGEYAPANTYWTQSQARVTNALERIRPLSPSHTRGGSRMRESRTYGSVRGACDETHVPTATCARQSWCDPAGGSPAQVRSSVRLVASVAWPLATVVAKRTQRLHGVWD